MKNESTYSDRHKCLCICIEKSFNREKYYYLSSDLTGIAIDSCSATVDSCSAISVAAIKPINNREMINIVITLFSIYFVL